MSKLPYSLFQFDAAEPATTAGLADGQIGIQIDSSGNLLNIRDAYSLVLATHGYGELSLVSSGGPKNAPYFHGNSASVHTAYDGIVLPADAAKVLVTPLQESWTAIFVIRQTGANPTQLLEMHGSAYVDIYGSGTATDGALSIAQNNGSALGSEASSSLTALNQWEIVSVICNGNTISIFRDGHLSLQTPSGTIGGVTNLTTFELLNNPQADVAFIELTDGAPSVAQHNAELQRLSQLYSINVTSVSSGSANPIPPVQPDQFADFMTTPIFPVSDTPPVDPHSSGPGDGLTLQTGSSPLLNMYFPGGTNPVNIPDEPTLRNYVYMNYLEGNLTQVTGSPQDTGQSDNSTFAAVARHYPLGSPHSTTPVMSDGLHMVAFCSQNRTNCTPGNVYAGFIRLTPVIRPGMTVKIRYRAAPGQHAWNSMWLFSGEQRTPGPGGNPYANYPALLDTAPGGHVFEIDINDNYTRSDDGGAPFGSQVDYGTPDIYGNVWLSGKNPHFTYLANDGHNYIAHPSAGPPYIGLPNIAWSSSFHDLVMNWRNDGTNLIDILVDGKVVAQSYLDYADLHSNDAAGKPLGLHLMIGNEAIPSFSPGAGSAIDNDGIETPGAEGWTQVVQEISVWNGNIANVDSLHATP